MIIKSIHLRDGISKGDFDFAQNTIICSTRNKAGKTTLLRCVLYALGYQIPSMKGIIFDRLEISLFLETDKGNNVQIFRRGSFAELLTNEEELHYSLPAQQNELQQHIFGISDNTILSNLLGVFYFDQEKGWTLLNRGKAIGSIHFSIEDFLRGVTGQPCDEERRKLKAIEEDIRKYRHMLDVAQYQLDYAENGDTIPFDTPAEEAMQLILQIENERKPLELERQRIKKAIKDNDAFKKYITAMKLRVQCACGKTVSVSEDTIVGLRDTCDFLFAKLKEVEYQISKLDNRISALRETQAKTETLVTVESAIQRFATELSHVKIDAPAVSRILKSLHEQKVIAQAAIHDALAREEQVIKTLTESVEAYLAEFNIDSKFGRDIFTSDLKSFSGTIFHLQVFAFKLSYVKLVREKTGCTLPLVIDSPNGREVERETVKKMMELLKRDFSDHQIIIATIYKPDPPFPSQAEVSLVDGILHLDKQNNE